MTSEKMAVLVVTGVIAVLLALTLARSRTEDAPVEAAHGPSAEPLPAAAKRPRHPFVRVVGDLGSPGNESGGMRRAQRMSRRTRNEPPAKAAPGSYLIRRGDTFERIARRILGSARHATALARANPRLDPKRLRVGDRIVIPAVSRPGPTPRKKSSRRKAWHVVRPGERLATIARRRYGREDAWRRIFEANRGKLESPDRLAVGMRLLLP